MKCAIFLAKGFEDCEALITIDMLRRAGVPVDSVSISDDLLVETSHGVKLYADKKWKEIIPSDYDVLILPGGKAGTMNIESFQPLKDALCDHFSSGKLTCAICAAPSVLGHLGILKEKHYTCFPDFASDSYGGIYENELAVEDGTVITGRGMGATIEFARLIIRRLTDESVMRKLEYGMQYEHSFRTAGKPE
ncbi:MAG: DJ-1/PfpI family protein [Solobacterium sp.]|nr:DJ-1/PfpI family protein [Solobacterium sp.]